MEVGGRGNEKIKTGLIGWGLMSLGVQEKEVLEVYPVVNTEFCKCVTCKLEAKFTTNRIY